MSSAKEYPLYINNRASELRVKSVKDKMSGVRSRSRKSRRAKSAQSARRTARSSRNPLEYFNPSNFKEIQMHYGENPNQMDCGKLESELNDAKNVIESQKDQIKDLDKKLIICNIKNAADMGDKVGKQMVADLLSKRKNQRNASTSEAAGGKRRRKSTTKKTQKKRRSKKFSIYSYLGIRG